MALVGPPDSGKTTLACSGANHPEFSPTVIMNFEDGLQSVRYGSKALRTPKITTTEGIDYVMNALVSRAGGFADAKCLVVDSLTKMCDVLFDEIAVKMPGKNGGIDRGAYAMLNKAVARYMNLLDSLDMHVIYLGLDRTLTKDDVPISITLSVPGQKLPWDVIAGIDNVFALMKVPSQPMVPATKEAEGIPAVAEIPAKPASVAMLTQQQGIQYARVRGVEFREALGEFIVNPTLPMLWDIYQESKANGRAKLEGQAS
jgi:hypothetical protein